MRVGGLTPSGQWSALALSLLLVIVVAALGAWASINAQSFYAGLIKPTWAPPPGVFGPVWSVLYLLMGIAAWLVWRSAGSIAQAADALLLYGLQLLLNALWSWLFFRWQLGLLAVIEVCLLWLTIWFTLLLFWRSNRTAGLLLLPYLLWVAFATGLTAACWHLNPDIL
jgi:translocator protein